MLIQEIVAITKLKNRNMEVANAHLNDPNLGGLNLDKSLANKHQKLQLPLIFVECKPKSKIKISQDETELRLKLSSDRKFEISDENHLFECMGLMQTSKSELNRLFDPQIVDYIQRSSLVQSLPISGTPINTSPSCD